MSSSTDPAYRSYVAGLFTASSFWGIIWYIYTLRTNEERGDENEQSVNGKDLRSSKRSITHVQEALREDPNEKKCDDDNGFSSRVEDCSPRKSRSVLKVMLGEGWQNEKKTQDSGQPSKKKIRWPWESIRKKGHNTKANSIVGDGSLATIDTDADSDFRTKELGRNKIAESSSRPQYPDGLRDAQTNDNHFDSNEMQHAGSWDGIQTKDESDDMSLEEKSGTCIGSIFGLDVGGTLSKLVYFQRTPQEKDQQNDCTDYNDETPFKTCNPDLVDISEDMENNEDSFARDCMRGSGGLREMHTSNLRTSMSDEPPKQSRLKRVRSMFDMAKSKFEQRAQALDRFYTLVSRLEDGDSGVKENNLSFHSPSLGGEFHFIRFETRYMTQAMKLIRAHSLHLNIVQMGATGGGAHKYANAFEENLGIQMAPKGELDSLVVGMQFVLSDVDGECYTFKPNEDFSRMHKPIPTPVAIPVEIPEKRISPEKRPQQRPHSFSCGEYKAVRPKKNNTVNETNMPEHLKGEDPDENLWARKAKREVWTRKVKRDVVAKSNSYPYMIVIIGTGVSVLRVDGLGKHERISGSTIGGGTYWGLCRLLTDVEDYESVLNLAERGKSSKVDMMVGDIYGEKVNVLEKWGLTPDVVASSFGKLGAKSEPAAGLKQEDLARALLLMVTNNIGQVAYLNAQIHNTKRIYFVGNFLRHNVISQQRLAYAINYWSKGKMEALFLEHEGYLGALGAYLLHQGSLSGKVPKKRVSKVRERRRKDPAQKNRSMSL